MNSSTAKLILSVACALLAVTTAAKASSFVVTMDEVAGNVVVNGSGSIDTADLSFYSQLNNAGSSIAPTYGYLAMGPYGTAFSFDGYNGLSGPTSFGSGAPRSSDGGAGDTVSIYAGSTAGELIGVPLGYVSGTALSDTQTFDGVTFATLGVTPGTYTWTWDGGADNFTLEIGPTPVPAALPLFTTGLGALGLLGWRRKKKAAALAT